MIYMSRIKALMLIYTKTLRTNIFLTATVLFLLMFVVVHSGIVNAQVQNPQQGSTGIQGVISSPPPATPATISIPRDNQVFRELPVTVSGLCQSGLLVKLFKNNVFAGSVMCVNGSFSLQIDLFEGRNELIARVYDELDQPGPDSNMVPVVFTGTRPQAISKIGLTSNYAKRGANPGELLSWPIVLSGGSGPYAISVDWGDGSALDLISQSFPGTFDITHRYVNPGVYNIIIKATDRNGAVAYLQLVGVGNGPLSQESAAGGSAEPGERVIEKTRILWEPALILIPFLLSTFWLGKRHELYVLRRKIERGERPF